ncbi:AAA family ATPase [Hippea maritima]|uniref:SMC domain protein n=1 Tax=Hippea maritima (strain ATCC 700847 / DSM 10411 / MH2) TaxID=760142 RepID=F2LWE1_HIPMA|nr:AAA family ATPase [Hippea maritima]AEA32987.1 SMC domain protein [Hippea maritima DSM 10411]
MFIKNIIITNFRNFNLLEVKFDKINIIKGKNGTGKTNLIEAVYLTLNGHPFKNNLKVLKKELEKPTILNAIIDKHTIFIKIDDDKKYIKLDSKLVRVVDLKKTFACLNYSINSFISFRSKDYLFSLVDRGISSYDHSIIDKLIEYKKTNRLKKELFSSPKPDYNMLNFLNDKIKSIVDEISLKRDGFILKLKNDVENCFCSFFGKKLELIYEIGKYNDSVFEKEKQKNRVLFGFKKDSLKIILNNKDLFLYSSVGEKKISLLCIVLSIAKMYNSSGVEPILLIDDLEGDLDPQVQKRAFDIIKTLPNQSIITTLGAYTDHNIITLE